MIRNCVRTPVVIAVLLSLSPLSRVLVAQDTTLPARQPVGFAESLPWVTLRSCRSPRNRLS